MNSRDLRGDFGISPHPARAVVYLAQVNGILPIRLLACLLAAISIFAIRPILRADTSGLPRERGALYLEDFLDQPYRLKVLAAGPIYYNADQKRFLGTLRAGQLVELQAISDNGALCRVRGQAFQGQVAGWIDARFLSPIDPLFVDGLHRSLVRRERVKALLAANQVALGMTPAEVSTSLGAPQKRSSRQDADGVSEKWEYLRYEQVARQISGVDAFGRLVASVVYERVPVGRFAVVFANGLVSAIEQTEGNLAASAQVKIVPPPVDLRF